MEQVMADDAEDFEPDGNNVPVLREQFELGEDEVVHIPTGARFWAYPEIAEPHGVNWNRAGDILDNGDQYEQEEIREIAVALLKGRLEEGG